MDDTLAILLRGEWSEAREGGFGGMSVLMKACMEHFQQTAEAVKAVLDTMKPKEKGHFIPQPAEGRDVPWTNDVAKDDRGLIFVTDKVCGLDVLEFDN